MTYIASPDRYQNMQYRRCGKSGLKLSAFSLGLWHNFGHANDFENSRKILRTSFDAGITHFDLANNYGPPPGSAEENFGKLLQQDFSAHRDELIISSKAGYYMWEGPYGEWGSKKYLVSSLDQSLKRMQLDYVDIFYHHRPDPDTPLEETMGALDLIVRQGKALYIGISNYQPEEAKKAFQILKDLGTPCLIHQPRYSMFERWVEDGLLNLLEEEGVGCIPFSPLAQGLLTDKYLHGVPEDSRVATSGVFLNERHLTKERLDAIGKLNAIAQKRGQKLAQMALSWILKNERITSVLIGASKPEQVLDSIKALDNIQFSEEELKEINSIKLKSLY
ncbi:MAG: L-glyceraldehyde 3-phosphate reductase [Bacteroidetes bacterium]|nr:L-glyceraldehyde 3-phosphate reductase [Bacteroidota bacterium]MBU1373078.1 L-glyceraldehyde 3-phosphate reductase [Bacteroidota bacterium]MBU1484259.1 L-glyceraldehyde 3-phosphate reductase [Bacteroidota bacterium]MBU1759948.1 L-glyceraldehyde 3-phosphate reductase [Bacteroidota bacterium]MBU2046432.1 L-glyceraldehyde 3-phosphate reductase [Bacteroidota bacterium]